MYSEQTVPVSCAVRKDALEKTSSEKNGFTAAVTAVIGHLSTYCAYVRTYSPMRAHNYICRLCTHEISVGHTTTAWVPRHEHNGNIVLTQNNHFSCVLHGWCRQSCAFIPPRDASSHPRDGQGGTVWRRISDYISKWIFPYY